MEKCCKICNETNTTKFYSSRKSKCKKCISDDYKNRTDKEDYYEKQLVWKNNNFVHFQILQAKHRAIRDNRKFELTDEIVLNKIKEQNNCCYISKLPLSFYPKNPYSISLDRLDNNKDYTTENTIIVTKFVNNCKNSLHIDKFKKLLKEVCDTM